MTSIINGIIALAFGLVIILAAMVAEMFEIRRINQEESMDNRDGEEIGDYRIWWIDADKHYAIVSKLGVVVARRAEWEQAKRTARRLSREKVEE